MTDNYTDPTPEIDERSALQKMRASDLTTDSMKRREALKAQTIAAASKANWTSFDLPIQPPNFGQAMTDGFGYC